MTEITPKPLADTDFEVKRPTLLTVLCILTFIVSAYFLVSGAMDFFAPSDFDKEQWDDISNQMAEALGGADESSAQIVETVMDATAITVEKGIKHATTLNIIQILVALLSAYGAYLMWSLRQRGFAVYSVAKIIGIVVPMILLGFNLVTIIVFGFSLFVGIIFILIYNSQRKYMH